MAKPLLLIDAGGTISSRVGVDGRLHHGEDWAARDRLLELAAEARVEIIPRTLSEIADALDAPIDSCDMQPRYWSSIARAVLHEEGRVDGVVLLHGTDTLAFTASALSFALAALDIPIILTGSQRSLFEAHSDAPCNIRLALDAAAGRLGPLGGDVAIAFAGCLLRGNRSTKTSANSGIGFASPGLPSLDPGAGDCRATLSRWRSSRPSSPRQPSTAFDQRIWIVDVWPGIGQSDILGTLDAVQPAGIVMRLFGVGVAPSSSALTEIAIEMNAKRVPVIAISTIPGLRLDWDRYENSLTFAGSPIVNGLDMTTEAAVTKLMWVLAATQDQEARRTLLGSNLAGEMASLDG
jgi:L-asparaginase/Glu-tRNA(Gln) amidotransferase subunit D